MNFNFLQNAPSNAWQWVGLFATVVGTLFSVVGLCISWLAAKRAQAAADAANQARFAARQQGRMIELEDLLKKMAEVRSIVPTKNHELLSLACIGLIGAISRFRGQSDETLAKTEIEALDVCVQQLQSVVEVSAKGPLDQKERRISQIYKAFSLAEQNLSRVTGTHRSKAMETMK